VGQPAQHPCSAGNAQPDLVGLMNLFIGWGMEIQKKKWLDRVGYR
jgi:hypothetical protein